MIKLYLHLGYHKTGSSFLQTMFAQNRNYLLENGIYFPSSKDDKNMLEGIISPGNGIELVEAIRANNSPLIIDLLDKWVKATITNNCDSLLLSSEGLFHVLAKSDFMNLFVSSCNEAGIKILNGLLFFRDPLSHAFSVYKHRGKRGTITNYGDWLKNGYETLDLTKSFLIFYKDFNIQWMFRKYTSDSERMANIAFTDFLGIKAPMTPNKERVNISLTLSEIVMIREVKDLLPTAYIREIHAVLSNLPRSKKADDQALQQYYTKITFEELIKYKSIINEVNGLLPIDEVLEFNEPEIKNNIDGEIINLSVHQIKIFTDFLNTYINLQDKFMFYLNNLLIRIKGRLNRISIKYSIMNSK